MVKEVEEEREVKPLKWRSESWGRSRRPSAREVSKAMLCRSGRITSYRERESDLIVFENWDARRTRCSVRIAVKLPNSAAES
jgi:hypothetical protein